MLIRDSYLKKENISELSKQHKKSRLSCCKQLVSASFPKERTEYLSPKLYLYVMFNGNKGFISQIYQTYKLYSSPAATEI